MLAMLAMLAMPPIVIILTLLVIRITIHMNTDKAITISAVVSANLMVLHILSIILLYLLHGRPGTWCGNERSDLPSNFSHALSRRATVGDHTLATQIIIEAAVGILDGKFIVGGKVR